MTSVLKHLFIFGSDEDPKFASIKQLVANFYIDNGGVVIDGSQFDLPKLKACLLPRAINDSTKVVIVEHGKEGRGVSPHIGLRLKRVFQPLELCVFYNQSFQTHLYKFIFLRVMQSTRSIILPKPFRMAL
jgi:hypothetical protein